MVLGANVGGQSLVRAVTVEDGGLINRTLAAAPVLSSRAQAAEAYALDFGEHRVDAEILHLLPNGFDGPNDICLGDDPAVTTTANFGRFSRFEWDGEVGYGLTERSVRLSPAAG